VCLVDIICYYVLEFYEQIKAVACCQAPTLLVAGSVRAKDKMETHNKQFYGCRYQSQGSIRTGGDFGAHIGSFTVAA
jgi:hypothetical protein